MRPGRSPTTRPSRSWSTLLVEPRGRAATRELAWSASVRDRSGSPHAPHRASGPRRNPPRYEPNHDACGEGSSQHGSLCCALQPRLESIVCLSDTPRPRRPVRRPNHARIGAVQRQQIRVQAHAIKAARAALRGADRCSGAVQMRRVPSMEPLPCSSRSALVCRLSYARIARRRSIESQSDLCWERRRSYSHR
jgi:hypothetical protein